MTGIVALRNYQSLYAVRQVIPGEVYEIPTSTDVLSPPITVCENPWGITASDDSQFVYVTCNRTEEIAVISTATNTVVKMIPVGGRPLGISFNRRPQAGTTTTDRGDACCYLEFGTWFDAPEQSFHGPTPARLNEIGNGSDTVTWRFPSILDGTYEISAWWTPGTDRATNTPFTVYQNGVGKQASLIRVDQSDMSTADRWNVLGTFDLAPNDSLVLSDDATGAANPSFVVADAIRLVEVTNVANEEARSEVPGSFRLDQNYPNPFNPKTTISYELDRSGHMDLRVYNLLGEAVRSLVQKTQAAGSYTMSLDASGLPSGVYYYTLSFGGFTSTRKMVFLK